MADNPRIEELRRRVQKDPASIAFAQLAEEYRRAGNYEDAIATCRAGLAVHPGYLSARVTLGRALLEMNDFASGTSSRSSRLIHGGVRYLEHGYLHLVFEASAERRRLLRLAPHLVRPLKFTWPVYRKARVPLWKLAAGLTLYDLLALFRNVGRHRLLSAGWMKRDQPAVLA